MSEQKPRQLRDSAYWDRVAWTAALLLLDRVAKDPAHDRLNPELQDAITMYLGRHPAPVPKSKP